MPQAVSYARFSSQRQSSGSSLERQLKLSKDYCDKHGLFLDESLTDEGLSAFSGDHTARGSLGRFLEPVQKGRIKRNTYLIVEHLDRLSRETVWSALAQFTSLIEAGIKIVTLFDEHVYESASQAVELDLITAILHMSEAHKASLTKSKRLKEAWISKRAKPVVQTTVRPAWVDVQKKDGVVVFVENAAGAQIVRRIFHEAASGLGSFTIAKRLTAAKIPALTGDKKHGKKHPKAGQSRANGWNRSRIIKIIKSDAALGYFQPHRRENGKRIPVGEPIANYYPVIIDQATATKARVNIAGRVFKGDGSGRKGEFISNLFSSVAKCGNCGASMVLVHRAMVLNKPGYLRCSVSMKDHARCDITKGFHYGKFEEAIIRDFPVIKYVVRSLPADDNSKQLNETLALKQADADRLKKNIGVLSDTLGEASNIKVIVDQIASMAERHAILTSEITALAAQLSVIARSQSDVNDLEKRRVIERLQSDDPDIIRKARSELAMAIRALFRQSIIMQRDRKIRLFKGALNTDRATMSIYLDENFNAGVWVGADLDGVYTEAPLMSVEEFRRTVTPSLGGQSVNGAVVGPHFLLPARFLGL